MTRLEEIRGRWAAATPGPWVEYHENGTPGQTEPFICPPATGAYLVQNSGGWEQQRKNAVAIAHAPADIAALTAAIEGVLALHRIVKIYDECECPPDTHPEDYDYIDCQDYKGCHNSITGIGCDECCVDGDFLGEACGESHDHSMDAATRCGTVKAITATLEPTP